MFVAALACMVNICISHFNSIRSSICFPMLAKKQLTPGVWNKYNPIVGQNGHFEFIYFAFADRYLLVLALRLPWSTRKNPTYALPYMGTEQQIRDRYLKHITWLNFGIYRVCLFARTIFLGWVLVWTERLLVTISTQGVTIYQDLGYVLSLHQRVT